MITKKAILDAIHGKMIISCQAVEGEPLYVEEKSIMYLMARAAKQAGTPAIRTSIIRDVIAIKEETGLPVIGLVKIQYPGYEGYITPTMKEVDDLVAAGSDVVAGNLLGLSLQVKDYKKMAAELGIGEITLRDIVKELEKPARDPRDDMPKPILRSDVLEMKDLKEGMVLKGTVRNVIDFGAFVDIGVHQDGLVHISEMTERFIKHPLEAVSVGDIVDVRVIGVDMKKKRISLSMKGLNK